MKNITIGIPTYKAHKTICDTLSSIQIQTIKDDVSIILALDCPEDDSYDYLKDRYPDLDITIVPCEKNAGPGIARQRALDNCKTDWITFIDADDIFINPVALERLRDNITPDCIEVQGVFYQEVVNHPQRIHIFPQENVNHPWVFGRLYNTRFLKENDIKFSELRAMEDGEFNWKIRMLIEGTPLKINFFNEPVYFWRTGSEHSITRIGADEKDGIPQYNFDLCQYGATVAEINAIKFCKNKNPFNGNITKFTVESMVGQYFTYIECLGKKPIFAKQNLFNAKKFYHECFKEIENQISNEILKQMYTHQMAVKAKDLIGIVPEITFFDFIDLVKTSEYNGEEEFKQIRSELPQYIIDNDIKTGVLENIIE